MIVAGIDYSLPTVVLLQETGIGTAEYAARTCYDSFGSSENDCVTEFSELRDEHKSDFPLKLEEVNNIEHSDLLDTLAWTHFHHSILEHANLTYLFKGTSRGVLQEEARHRIQSLSVRSTRYTMSNVINAFVAEIIQNPVNTASSQWFIDTIRSFDLFVVNDKGYIDLEIKNIFEKLKHQYGLVGHDEFMKTAVAKSSLSILDEPNPISQAVFEYLEAGKKKRNVGDAFKHIVDDNWKVDMVVTMNLRALKNFFGLRDSGAAYFQIRALAQAMKKVTPQKYLDLIVRSSNGDGNTSTL